MLLRNNDGARQDIVTHAGLRSFLDQPRRDLNLKAIEPGMVSELPFLGELWDSIDKSVPIALESISSRRAGGARDSADALEPSLRCAIGFLRLHAQDRKSGGWGKSGSVRVDRGGGSHIKQKTTYEIKQ